MMAEYEVQEILESRVIKGEMHFKIRWKGFLEKDDTWEPEANLTSCRDKLNEFLSKIKESKVEKCPPQLEILKKAIPKETNSRPTLLKVQRINRGVDVTTTKETIPKETNSRPTLLKNRGADVTTTKEASFKCSVCSRSFRSRSLLKEHANNCFAEQNEGATFTCKLCKSGGKTFSMLEKHLHLRHSEPRRMFACPICRWAHTSLRSVSTHMKEHNVTSNPNDTITTPLEKSQPVTPCTEGTSCTKKDQNCMLPTCDPVADDKITTAENTTLTDSSGLEENTRHVESDITLLDKYYDTLTNLKELCHTLCNRFPNDRVLSEHRHVLHSLSSNVKLAKANLSLSCLRKKSLLDTAPVNSRDRTNRSIADSSVLELAEDGSRNSSVFSRARCNTYGQQPLEDFLNVLQASRQSRIDVMNNLGVSQPPLCTDDNAFRFNRNHSYDIVDVTDTLMSPMEDILCNTTDQQLDDDCRIPPMSLLLTRSQELQQSMSSLLNPDQQLPEDIFTAADDFLVAADRIEMDASKLCDVDSPKELMPDNSSCLLTEVPNLEMGPEETPQSALQNSHVSGIDVVMDDETLGGLLDEELLSTLNGTIEDHTIVQRAWNNKQRDRNSQVCPNPVLVAVDTSDSFKDLDNCVTTTLDPTIGDQKKNTATRHPVRTVLQKAVTATTRKSIKRKTPTSNCQVTEPQPPTTSKRRRRRRRQLDTEGSSDISEPNHCTTWADTHVSVDGDILEESNDMMTTFRRCSERLKNNSVTSESDFSTVDAALYHSLNSLTVEKHPVFVNFPYSLVTQEDDSTETGQQTEEGSSHETLVGGTRTAKEPEVDGCTRLTQKRPGTGVSLDVRVETRCHSPNRGTSTTIYSCPYCNLTSKYRASILRHNVSKHPHLSPSVKQAKIEKENQSVDNNKIA